MMSRRLLFIAAVFFLTGLPNAIGAELVRSANVEAELLAENSTVKPGDVFWVGLKLKMDKNWHTYWKNSGDSGLPTSITWDLPSGVIASEIHWPNPKKIMSGSLTTYGYEGEVMLLTEIKIPESFFQSILTLRAEASWLSCKVECVPGQGTFSIELPVNTISTVDSAKTQLFAQARSALPIRIEDIALSAFYDKDFIEMRLESTAFAAMDLNSLEFFPYNPELIQHSAAQTWSKSDSSISIFVRRSNITTGDISSLSGVLAASPGWRGPGSEAGLLISELKPEKGTIYPSKLPLESVTWQAVLIFSLFAFLGGLLLNLMPCVLPVLSIKILGIIEQSKSEKKHALAHGFAFAGGVMISFWILALLLLTLRAAGEQIGWGFQLQKPEFIIFLLLLFWIMALNLFGVFEVGVSLTGVGGSAKTRTKGLWGSWMSGLLATVVATPCTAPFMGSALGFALSGPSPLTFLIFTSLGIGMAFPYLLMTANPNFLRWIPKPGPWMLALKKILGALLVLTCLWLLWVLHQQTSQGVILVTAGSLLLAATAAFLYGNVLSALSRKKIRTAVITLCIILVALALLLPLQAIRMLDRTEAKTHHLQNGISWIPYDPIQIQQTLKEGKIVFIDFTAAWCLTCQVNESFALNSESVKSKFQEYGIVPFKADWTQHNPEITKALENFGRNSIPLYVVLHPRGGAPLLLPEILTPKIVIEYLDKLNSTDNKGQP